MPQYVPLTEENLAEVCALSNRNLTFDEVTLDFFRHLTLGDPDYEPAMALVAVVDGKPCGYMMAVCRKNDDNVRATIKLFAVDEEFRGRKIATEMLSRIEAEAKARGAKSLSVGFIPPNYITAGIDPRYTAAVAFLIRRGFTHDGGAFNMDVDLSVSDWSTEALEEKLAKEGVICRRVRRDERAPLRKWMAADGWSIGWQVEVGHAIDQEPVAVFVAEKDGEYLGFASYDGVRPGWFGPMATTKNLRTGGIGSVTFLRCLQDMKAVGYRICEINAVGPLYFYSKVSNAIVSRMFWHMEKELG